MAAALLKGTAALGAANRAERMRWPVRRSSSYRAELQYHRPDPVLAARPEATARWWRHRVGRRCERSVTRVKSLAPAAPLRESGRTDLRRCSKGSRPLRCLTTAVLPGWTVLRRFLSGERRRGRGRRGPLPG